MAITMNRPSHSLVPLITKQHGPLSMKDMTKLFEEISMNRDSAILSQELIRHWVERGLPMPQEKTRTKRLTPEAFIPSRRPNILRKPHKPITKVKIQSSK